MRFTVFIHCPDPKLAGTRAEAKRLNSFFRSKTDYFRSYLLAKSPDSVEHFIKLFRHRYIVIFSGHAACGCFHPDHPKDKIKSKKNKKKEKEVFRDVPRERFNPDQDKCPSDIQTAKFYGCGHRQEVSHRLVLGKVGHRAMRLAVLSERVKSPGIWVFLVDTDSYAKIDANDHPRLMFYAATCRSTLMTRLGEEFTKKGDVKYYVGITYVSGDNANLCEKFFERWIKGTKKEPAPTEYDVSRLVDCFVDAAKPKIYACEHPRITDRSLTLSATGPKASTASPAGGAGKALE